MKSTTTRIQDVWMKRLVIVGGALLLTSVVINFGYWTQLAFRTLTTSFNDPVAWRSMAAFAGMLLLSVVSVVIGVMLGYFGSRSQRKLVRAARAVTLGLIGFGFQVITIAVYMFTRFYLDSPYVPFGLPIQITQFWPDYLAIVCTFAISIFYLRTVASGTIRHGFISVLGWILAVLSAAVTSFLVLSRLFTNITTGMVLGASIFTLAIMGIGCVLTYLLVARHSELRAYRWDSVWMMAMMITAALGLASFYVRERPVVQFLFAVMFVVLPLAAWLVFVWPWLDVRRTKRGR